MKLSVALSNFEGPLDLLLYLIQKEEMPIQDISLSEITKQFSEESGDVDLGAEFLSLASTLLLLKSRSLLPGEEDIDEAEESQRWEMIQKLLEYCRFKEVAKGLAACEEAQSVYYPRGQVDVEYQRGLGLDEVGLEDLTALLADVMSKIPKTPPSIKKETWEIGPKLAWWQSETKKRGIPFAEVFTPDKCRGELIVLFLSLLELLKLQKLVITKEDYLIQCSTS